MPPNPDRVPANRSDAPEPLPIPPLKDHIQDWARNLPLNPSTPGSSVCSYGENSFPLPPWRLTGGGLAISHLLATSAGEGWDGGVRSKARATASHLLAM